MFSNQKKEVSCENGIFHNHCSDNFEPISKDNCALALHCPLLRASTGFFFPSSRGNFQPSNLSIGTKVVVKVVFCTNLVVIMSNPFRRITLHLPCTVPSYADQQFFFWCVSKGNTPASNLSIGTKLVVKVVFCTIIVVIMLNLF